MQKQRKKPDQKTEERKARGEDKALETEIIYIATVAAIKELDLTTFQIRQAMTDAAQGKVNSYEALGVLLEETENRRALYSKWVKR